MKPAYMSKVAEVTKAATRLNSFELIEGTSNSGDNNNNENNANDRTNEERITVEHTEVPVNQDSSNPEEGVSG